MKKVILLDRDGVINYDSPNYIKSVDEFEFIPGSLEAIVKLTKAGYQIGVATNQSGLSRGLYDENILNSIHTKMLRTVHDAGGDIAIIKYCPHLPDMGCICRKPQPGMLHSLAKWFECDLKNVPFLGDKLSDVEAANRAGAIPIMISSGKDFIEHVPTYKSLADYVNKLM